MEVHATVSNSLSVVREIVVNDSHICSRFCRTIMFFRLFYIYQITDGSSWSRLRFSGSLLVVHELVVVNYFVVYLRLLWLKW